MRQTDERQTVCNPYLSPSERRLCNSSVFSFLRQLKTWHCSYMRLTAVLLCAVACCRNQSISPARGANVLWHAAAAVDRWTDRRTDTVPLHGPCCIRPRDRGNNSDSFINSEFILNDEHRHRSLRGTLSLAAVSGHLPPHLKSPSRTSAPQAGDIDWFL